MNSYSSNRNRKDHTRRGSSVGAKRRSGGQRLLYDAHGVRIKQSRFPQKLKRALLFYILPYLVINGLIFFVVTATPDINLNVAETDDYQNTQVEFEVKSILPISEMTVQMESVDVPYTETSRHHYISDISHNGMFYVTVKSWNGMQTTNYVNVSVLDDTAPSIDEETCNIANGYLTFVIEDSQSGVDYDSIYVPAMQDRFPVVTAGWDDFQHPRRSNNTVATARDDYFSQHVIYLSLLAYARFSSLVP